MNIGRRECNKEHDIRREMAVDREKHEDSEDVTAWWIACCLSHPNFQQHAQTSSWLHWLPWLFCVSWLVSAVSSCFLRVLRYLEILTWKFTMFSQGHRWRLRAVSNQVLAPKFPQNLWVMSSELTELEVDLLVGWACTLGEDGKGWILMNYLRLVGYTNQLSVGFWHSIYWYLL